MSHERCPGEFISPHNNMNYADMAAHLVFGDRNADYGDPREDFSGVAQMWSGLLNAKLRQNITPEDVAMMMVCLKLRRQAHRPKTDNIVDAHGYLMTLEWITTGEKPLPKYMEQEGGAM